MIQRECNSCQFFECLSNGNGLCHRHAPKPKREKEIKDEWKPFHAEWPRVSVEDWCGEFQPLDGSETEQSE